LKKNYVKYEVALIYCGVEQLISKATNWIPTTRKNFLIYRRSCVLNKNTQPNKRQVSTLYNK
jgi:hypothetical protein